MLSRALNHGEDLERHLGTEGGHWDHWPALAGAKVLTGKAQAPKGSCELLWAAGQVERGCGRLSFALKHKDSGIMDAAESGRAASFPRVQTWTTVLSAVPYWYPHPFKTPKLLLETQQASTW